MMRGRGLVPTPECREEEERLNERMNRMAVLPAVVLGLLVAATPACAEGPKQEADTSVAAEIGGQKISTKELDDYLRKTNARAFQEFYDARRAALEGLISDRLLEAEAKSKNLTVDKLKESALAPASTVTDAEIETFYNENQARMGGRTLDQIKEQIRSFLVGQKQQKAMTDLITSLKEKSNVQIMLEPPRADVKIAENDPVRGRKDAPVQIVEFSDFQ